MLSAEAQASAASFRDAAAAREMSRYGSLPRSVTGRESRRSLSIRRRSLARSKGDPCEGQLRRFAAIVDPAACGERGAEEVQLIDELVIALERAPSGHESAAEETHAQT